VLPLQSVLFFYSKRREYRFVGKFSPFVELFHLPYAHKKSADKTLLYLYFEAIHTHASNKRVKPVPKCERQSLYSWSISYLWIDRNTRGQAITLFSKLS